MTPPTPTSSPVDEAACTRLCIAFANHIDARRYGGVLDLFTPDAVLDRMGTVARGRGAISKFLEARPVALETRHLCTNIEITLVAPDAAVGTCYVLFFQGSSTDGGSAQAIGPPGVVEYHDRFERTAEGWRISERRIRMAMRPAASTSTI
ncbi:MAG: nuclear transport factor 2 family protein [Pseudomonadota bacterium]